MKINSLALVIAEPFVKRAYPGGVQGFLGDQVAEQGPEQRVLRSGQLVVVVDDDPERLVATYARIQLLTGQSIDEGAPCVIVDPTEGLLAPCDWLSFAPLGEGLAELRFTDSSSDEPATRESEATAVTTPSSSKNQLTLGLDEGPTLLRLTEENGRITWLDTSTGRQLVSEALPPANADNDEDAPRPMIDAATAMIERRGWTFEKDDDGDIAFTLNAGPLMALNVRLMASNKGNVLICCVRLPGRVFEERRSQVGQYLMGANWLLEVGGFDMDPSDGEIVYRAGVVAPNGLLQPSDVELALDRSMQTVRYYAAGLIEVAAGADPRDVLARVEGD